MARYWVYLNDEVTGPYGVDQLIRLRGFSRQTQVCIEDFSGKPKNWISPADIPELAHIFKAVDEHLAEPAAAPKAASKPPVARPSRSFVPAVTLRAPKRNMAQIGGWVLLVSALVAAGYAVWSQYARRGLQARERQEAQALIENVHLPPPSPYGTLPQYFQEKGIHPRWEFEKLQDGLSHVTLSWYAPALTVYAFEVNSQAQTVRGINSAASQLLSEGFPAPPARRPKETPRPKKSPVELFSQAMGSYRDAIEGGDFQTVWNMFSQRKKSEMAKAGISSDGFVRLQGLTHRVESGKKQEMLKTKQESDTEMLVLVKETQPGLPDIFLKQLWVFEEGAWKLDDEQKRTSSAQPKPNPEPAAPGPASNAPPPAPAPGSLPGMSH
jgi:hypothetical protein